MAHLWIVAAAVLALALLMGIFKYGESVFNRKGSETLVETMRNMSLTAMSTAL